MNKIFKSVAAIAIATVMVFGSSAFACADMVVPANENEEQITVSFLGFDGYIVETKTVPENSIFTAPEFDDYKAQFDTDSSDNEDDMCYVIISESGDWYIFNYILPGESLTMASNTIISPLTRPNDDPDRKYALYRTKFFSQDDIGVDVAVTYLNDEFIKADKIYTYADLDSILEVNYSNVNEAFEDGLSYEDYKALFVPEGYEFKGWMDVSTGKIVKPGDTNSDYANVVLTAVVTKEITVTYEPDNGNDDPITETCEAGEITLPECTFTPAKGMEFQKWEIEGEDGFAYYYPGDVVELYEDTTITAVWGSAKCTVSYDSNNGDALSSAFLVDMLSVVELGDCEYTALDGKKFAYWEVNGKKYMPGDTFTVETATTIKAIWEDVATSPSTGSVLELAPVALASVAFAAVAFVTKKKRK